MLTLIRNMLRTKFAGLLFILLIVAMGAWGVTDIFSGNLGNNFAVAGNQKLTQTQFDQQVERQLRTAQDDRGRAISKAQAVERGMIDQIFQREIFRTTLMAYAEKLGAIATDEAVLDVITTDPSFQSDTGTFDTMRYRQLLQANGFSTRMFEDFLKRDMTISRITETTQAGLRAPAALSALQASYNGELRKAAWFILPRAELPPLEPVTDEELETFYNEQKQALTNAQRRAVSLISLSTDDFLNQAEFTEDELKAYYDSVKAQEFSGPDTRTWTEFVFQTEDQARNALGTIAGGGDPSSLAGLASSSERSGQQNSMSNANLRERVFGPLAQPGSIFGPVKTGNFFTIARLEAIEPGEVVPFENVREQIVQTLSEEQAIGLYYDSLSRLDNLIGTGASLEEIARQMGTPVLSFAPVDRSGVTEGGAAPSVLRQDPDILSRAFELTEDGKTARFGQDEVAYILRVDDIIEAHTPPLDEIREDLRQVLTTQRENEALSSAADALKAEIESGTTSFREAAERYNAEITAPDTSFTRRPDDSSGIPQALISGVFSLREQGDIYVAPTQNRDEVAIVQLVEIHRPSADELNAVAPVSEPQMRQQLANDLLEAFVADIQSNVELEVNSAAFDAYKDRVNPDS